MKIKITNSPFDFDEVGHKTAKRWVDQEHAFFSDDGLTLTFNPTARFNAARFADEQFDRNITAHRGGKITGEWIPRDSSPRMPGAPAFKNLQFSMGCAKN